MKFRLIDDHDAVAADFCARPIQIRSVDEVGELLDTSYELLSQLFERDVLDSLDTFREQIVGRERQDSANRFFVLAAYFEIGDNGLVVGTNSATTMRLLHHGGDSMLAIANIATSPKLPNLGIRGVGRSLIDAAIQHARGFSNMHGYKLNYMVAEAETRSLRLWQRCGFKWPAGVRYFQPPLEFDDRGMPKFSEVPENFVVRNLMDKDASSIDTAVVGDLIATLYENWFLSPHRESLSPAAMERVNQYVMGRVFEKVRSSIPSSAEVELVDPTSANFE